MRILCAGIDDFLVNLEMDLQSHLKEDYNPIHRKCVHVSHLEERESSNSQVVHHVLYLTAIVILPDEGDEILVESSEDCGIDYLDGDQDLAGSKKVAEKVKMLREFCERFGLGLRPGIIDY